MGLPRPALWNNLAFTGVNFTLNYVFVRGLPAVPRIGFGGWDGLGFAGSPVSLSLSRCLQPLAYFLYMFVWRKAHVGAWPGFTGECFKRSHVQEYLLQALPNSGTFLMQSLLGQATTLMIARLGNLAVSTNSATMELLSVFSGGLTVTAGQVASIRVGTLLGAGRPRAAQNSARLIFVLILFACLFVAALALPAPLFAMRLITNDPDVIAYGAKLLPIVVTGIFLQGTVSFVTQGVLAGQGRAVLSSILSLCVEIPLSLGGTAVMLFVLHFNLLQLTWGANACIVVQMIICFVVWGTSNWGRYAREARLRSEAAQAAAAAASEGEEEEEATNDKTDDDENVGCRATPEEWVDAEQVPL